MLLILPFVNGAEPAILLSTASATFESVIQRVTTQGENGRFEGITRFLRIAKGSPTKEEWAFPKVTEDRHRRAFNVIFDRSTETLKAAHVELFVGKKDKPARKEQELFFLVGLNGALLEAGYAFGLLDNKGKVILGPALAPFQHLDIKSAETRSLFQQELDFWIKGVGRKPPAGGN